jgi:benzoylformate decarboxylase
MMFGVQAIWTAAQNNVPVVYVVLNNGQYGILKAFAAFQRTPGVPGLDLPGLDIPEIARGFGAEARRVTAAADALPTFQAAFDTAITRQTPVLLDVAISPEIGDLFGQPVA